MESREADRRRGDRRSSDRRSPQGRRREDGSDSGESYFDPGWLASGDLPTDSRFLDRQARSLARAQDTALSRVYRTYGAARAVVGLGLVAVIGLSSVQGLRSSE
ncbi:MAG: histidine kinase, partial [Rubrivivax sp.]|nr:histidine kinase [Rubrivivax sp.]